VLHQHPPSALARQESDYTEISEDTFSDVTDNALKKTDSSEEEDIYETIANDTTPEVSPAELRTRNDAKGASLNRISLQTKTKLRGFKGFLSNTKDKLADTKDKLADQAHAHSQSRRVTHSPRVADHHNSQTSIASSQPDWEFGKRVAKPRGPRPEPAHWIKIK